MWDAWCAYVGRVSVTVCGGSLPPLYNDADAWVCRGACGSACDSAANALPLTRTITWCVLSVRVFPVWGQRVSNVTLYVLMVVLLKGFDEFGLNCDVGAVQMDCESHAVERGFMLEA